MVADVSRYSGSGLSAVAGARLKITRSFLTFKDPDGGKPLIDVGVGASLEMDSQRVMPVARIKIKDFLSIQVRPRKCVRGVGWGWGWE